jgi:fatty acid synthase subunit beta
LAAPGTGGAPGGGGSRAVIDSEEFLKFQADQQKFAAQHVELYMHYLGRDSRAGEVAFDQEKTTSLALQAKIDLNRVDPDMLQFMQYNINQSDVSKGETYRPPIALPSLTEPTLTCFFMQYNFNQSDASKGETYRQAKEFSQKLIDNTKEIIGKALMYKF